MIYVVAYIAALVVFGILDGIWLSTMASRLYQPVLGDTMLDRLRIAPALVFYLLYPVGIVVFAAMPAIQGASAGIAISSGALFGLLAYATYDLTNYATLRKWTLKLAVVDLVYGSVASSLMALSAYHAVRWFVG
jgi:uncharacterized membrane protein